MKDLSQLVHLCLFSPLCPWFLFACSFRACKESCIARGKYNLVTGKVLVSVRKREDVVASVGKREEEVLVSDGREEVADY